MQIRKSLIYFKPYSDPVEVTLIEAAVQVGQEVTEQGTLTGE